MAEDNKVDLMAQFPDEVLMEIFDHLPTLRDKLRLESVNTRFRRCLIELLRTRPIPFTYRKGALNGCHLKKRFSSVLGSVGKKVKFTSIDIDVRNCVSPKELNSVLAALVSSRTCCLDKVTAFTVVSYWGYNRTLLKKLFAKCTKLSEVRLNLYSPTQSIGPFPVNLDLVLKDQALTQLSVKLFHYTQELVIQVFQAIKPNSLKKIDLVLSQSAFLNMDVLVTELRGGGWSALEEMHIGIVSNFSLDTLFSSLTGLPKLRKCNFVLCGSLRGPHLTSLTDGLNLLFANRTGITVEHDVHFNTRPNGCHFVALIRQVQSKHQDLQIGFGSDGRILTLTQGKVTFKHKLDRPAPCNNTYCPECRIFYPLVLSRIVSEANRLMKGMQSEQVHLANAQLDRCRVDSVADHLKASGWWNTLEAEMNEARDFGHHHFRTAVLVSSLSRSVQDHC